MRITSLNPAILYSVCDKCQDIGYPDVSRHRLPEIQFLLSVRPSVQIGAIMLSLFRIIKGERQWKRN